MHMEQGPKSQSLEQSPQLELEGFYLPPDVIKENIETITDFFGDNRVDEEGRVNWYKMLLDFGVSLDSQEEYAPADEDELDLPPLDPERGLLRAGKISEFFKHNLSAQAAYFRYISNEEEAESAPTQ